MSEHDHDTILWNAFRRGDRQAFERIYREHYAAIYNYGHSIYPDTDVVRDGIQTLYIDLWRQRTNLGTTDQIKPYLFRGLRRLIIKERQKQQRLCSQERCFDPILPSMEERTILLETTNFRKRKIHEVVQTLTHKQREVIHLRFYENYDNQTIATLMGITVNTVYNLVSLAIAKLRSQLIDHKELFYLFFLALYEVL